MNQLANRQERYTIDHFLQFVFVAYAAYGLFHTSAALIWFEGSKVVSVYSAIMCLVYYTFAVSTWRLRRVLKEQNFEYSSLKQSLDLIFVVNIGASIVSSGEAIILGVWFWNYGDETTNTILYLMGPLAIFIFVVVYGLLLIYSVIYMLLVIRHLQKGIKSALTALESPGAPGGQVRISSPLSASQPNNQGFGQEGAGFNQDQAEPGPLEDAKLGAYQAAPQPINNAF